MCPTCTPACVSDCSHAGSCCTGSTSHHIHLLHVVHRCGTAAPPAPPPQSSPPCPPSTPAPTTCVSSHTLPVLQSLIFSQVAFFFQPNWSLAFSSLVSVICMLIQLGYGTNACFSHCWFICHSHSLCTFIQSPYHVAPTFPVGPCDPADPCSLWWMHCQTYCLASDFVEAEFRAFKR